MLNYLKNVSKMCTTFFPSINDIDFNIGKENCKYDQLDKLLNCVLTLWLIDAFSDLFQRQKEKLTFLFRYSHHYSKFSNFRVAENNGNQYIEIGSWKELPRNCFTSYGVYGCLLRFTQTEQEKKLNTIILFHAIYEAFNKTVTDIWFADRETTIWDPWKTK